MAAAWRPAQWLVVDAALAAIWAGLALTLLLFLINPEPPLTLGGFVHTLIALGPAIMVMFVLLGPGLVLIAVSLRVGHTTGHGLRLRYVVRFALLDALLLGVAAGLEMQEVGSLLPRVSQLALALLIATCGLTAIAFLVLMLVDLEHPGRIGAPVVATIGLAVTITFGVIADLRRVRPSFERPASLSDFVPEGPALVIEIAGLDLPTVREASERGLTPALESLLARGASATVDPGPLAAPLVVHTSLLTGRTPPEHGVLGEARHRPRGGNVSFALLPRGLFLRKLMFDPLWETIPNDRDAVRTVALPGIARALGLRSAMIGDPLRWPSSQAQVAFDDKALQSPREVTLPSPLGSVACPEPTTVGDRFFSATADELPSRAEANRLVKQALGQDLCTLSVAQRIAAAGRVDLLWVRLSGYPRLAQQFAGLQEGKTARAVSDRELDAYGRTLIRVLRELDTPLGQLIDTLGPRARVMLISPQGLVPRHDTRRLWEALIGAETPSASWEGPQLGMVIFGGEGVSPGRSWAEPIPVTSLLPTLLWSQGLPAAENMGPLVPRAFTPDFLLRRPVVAVPSFGAVGTDAD
ncbi:MAG: alkaline phosphatase family protein [Acidobacteriota bacterium]